MWLALAMAGLVLAVSALYLTVQLRQSRQQAQAILRQLEGKALASDKIRIVYTAHSLDVGGAEKVALDLMRNIDPQRFQIILIIREADNVPTKFDRTIRRAEERGMIITKKPKRKLLPYGWMQRNKLGKIRGLLPFAMNIIKEIFIEYELYRAIRPQIIHLHKVLSFEPFVKKLIAKAAGIPVIITTYHNFPVFFSRSKYFPVRGIIDGAIKQCVDYLTLKGLQKIDDVMIATSPEEKEAHVATGVPAEKIVVISNGIELSAYEKPPSRETNISLKKKLGIPPEAFVFGHVARLNVQKAQKNLIEAAETVLREFPQAYLVMIGDGEDRPALEAQIAGISDGKIRQRILMLGNVRDIEIAQYYFLFDVFVLPSRFEGQSLVNMEAMAAGTPIIAARVGGVPSTVGSEAAILVEHDNPEALALAMRTLVLDQDLRQRMGSAGRRRAFSHFKVEQAARNHEELYLKLLEQSGNMPSSAHAFAPTRSGSSAARS